MIPKVEERFLFLKNELYRLIYRFNHDQNNEAVNLLEIIIKEAVYGSEELDADERCWNNCKSMYFCELKAGHLGRHKAANGGLGWDD